LIGNTQEQRSTNHAADIFLRRGATNAETAERFLARVRAPAQALLRALRS